ncbi:MAG: alanyl-tRNA editing protein [Thermoplasmata archaeon]|nr:alanyl-tRNA editing protein [Thermoplasmata archaeon]
MERLYLADAYIREFDATVLDTEGGGVLLDRTAFYPGGGGQPADTGRLEWDGGSCAVTGSEGDRLFVDGNPPPAGARVNGALDWDRRYAIMRAHTALHVIDGVAYKDYGVDITGNQLYPGRGRLDLSFDNMTRELAEEIIAASNAAARRGLQVKAYFISREEFAARPQLMRVAGHLYDKYTEFRIVEIEGFDMQADGGTHVANTSEIGAMVLSEYKSKGARNKRIYVDLR